MILPFLASSVSAHAATLKPIPFPKDLCPVAGRELLAEEDRVDLLCPGESARALASQVETQTGKSLTPVRTLLNVLTSHEWAILKQHLGMAEVRELAHKHGLLKMPVTAVCLKRIEANGKSGPSESWFVEVEALAGLAFRRELWRKYLGKGGHADGFERKRWVPHVAVGTRGPMGHDSDQAHREKLPCAGAFTR